MYTVFMNKNLYIGVWYSMQVSFNNGNDKEYQYMLNNLLKNIFFDFQFWYDLNLWDENYESYSIAENGEIVSNICILRLKYCLTKINILLYLLER